VFRISIWGLKLFGGYSHTSCPVATELNFETPVSPDSTFADIYLIQVVAYPGLTHTKDIGKLVMRLTGFVCTYTRNHWKTLRQIFENY